MITTLHITITILALENTRGAKFAANHTCFAVLTRKY